MHVEIQQNYSSENTIFGRETNTKFEAQKYKGVR